jgi:Uri superfamily endonuclease
LKGIYTLIIKIEKDINVNIGALGYRTFQKGCYAYVGSSQTNLEKRIKRHLRKNKPIFWHIDYLLNNEFTRVTKVFFKQADKTQECVIANMTKKYGEEIAGFGSTDCQCNSHLFRLFSETPQFALDLMKELEIDKLKNEKKK